MKLAIPISGKGELFTSIAQSETFSMLIKFKCFNARYSCLMHCRYIQSWKGELIVSSIEHYWAASMSQETQLSQAASISLSFEAMSLLGTGLALT
jgi:hypothetical protein